MTKLERKVFEKLDLYENHTRNPAEWFRRGKMYAVLMIILFARGCVLWVAAHILMAILYIPHEIYERLDRWV